MVLAELGQKLTKALRKLNTATVINEEVNDLLLKLKFTLSKRF
jgi:hypothetical protein